MIRYISTRGKGQPRSSASAVIKGIAEDKGLFVPETIPALPFRPSEMVGRPYKDVAEAVIGAFFDDYLPEEIRQCVDGAYDSKFEAAEIVPVKSAGGAYFLELYHGRTAAFKDMALSILPYLMTTAVRKEKEEKQIVILTATSGDTGKAALEGFADIEGTQIIVFYPSTGVSEVQKRQMTTQEGKNTHVFGILGNFDDAQTGVKQIFDDREFNENLEKTGFRLSSANSINIGRLVPQVAYYVYGYIRLLEKGVIQEGDPVNIVVPTGNFGNILASYYASEMGIPVKTFICASNQNKVLTDFFNTGVYDIHRDFYVTYSPSMDILISSNLERLLYHLSGDPEEITSLMEQLSSKGIYKVNERIREGLGNFHGGFADDRETLRTITEVYENEGYLMDTHTAVACKVYQDYRKETGDNTPALIASTASAYKFASNVASALGLPASEDGFAAVRDLAEKTGVPVPSGLRDLDRKTVRHSSVIDKNDLRKAILDSLKQK